MKSSRFPVSRGAVGAVLVGLVAGTITLAAAERLSRDGIGPIDTHPRTPPPSTSAGHGVTLSSRIDRTAVERGGDGIVRMELVLTAEERALRAHRVPTDLVVVLDRSGSMQGRKIADARHAVLGLIGALDESDRFALVSYANDARVDSTLQHVVGAGREAAHHAVRSVAVGGGTNMSAGLDAALAMLEDGRVVPGRSARVILVSDGLANQGDATVEGLASRGRRLSRNEGVLSTVGVGIDFNEVLMTRVADAGTGNFWFLEDAASLDAVLAGELRSAATTVASALRLELTPRGGASVVEAAGLPLDRRDGRVVVRPGALFAGQERRLWITWRVPVDGVTPARLGDVALTWNDGHARRRLELDEAPRIALVDGRAAAIASIDGEAWGAALGREALQGLKQRVSQAIARGDDEAAAAEVDAFLLANEPVADAVDSDAARESLKDAKALRRELEEVRAAPAAAPARRALAKRQWAEAQDERRAGAKPDVAEGR